MISQAKTALFGCIFAGQALHSISELVIFSSITMNIIFYLKLASCQFHPKSNWLRANFTPSQIGFVPISPQVKLASCQFHPKSNWLRANFTASQVSFKSSDAIDASRLMRPESVSMMRLLRGSIARTVPVILLL